MIRLLGAEDESSLKSFCQKESPFACRIWSTAAAYGFNMPFARFWIQERDGAATAAVCKLDTAAVLEADKRADFEELKGFLNAVDVGTLLCSEKIGVSLQAPAVRKGRTMVCRRKPEQALEPVVIWNPGIRELYALLQDCRTELFPVPEFEPFYLDLSHRTRHGTACSAGILREGKLAACAVASHLTETAAVISAVAVRPSARRQGLGSAVVQALLSGLHKESSFVFRAERENEEFYSSLGFSDCGGWMEWELT